jgi:hypothetical protein
MELFDSLNAIRRGYGHSVGVLTGYLAHMSDSIKKLQKDHHEIVGKFEAVRSGAPDPSPPKPGEKRIQLTLKPEEADIVVEAMRFMLDRTSAYPNLMFRMSFIYLIALFDAFLADVFSVVVKTRPKILKSSKKQISYERLFEFGSYEALVESLAGRELNELSYKSMKDQAEYYRDRFGVALEESGVAVSKLVELRATRNLLVHNNGLVNEIYLDQVPSTTYKSGEDVQVNEDYFRQAVVNLDTVVKFVTTKLIEKHATAPFVHGVASLPES